MQYRHSFFAHFESFFPNICLSFFVIFISLTPTLSQDVYSKHKSNALKAYQEAFEHDRLLKNGKEYGYFYSNVEGRHVIGDTVGSLKYDGVSYPKVDVHYDLYNDLVLVRNVQAGGRRFLILKQTEIEAFTINNKQFIHLKQATDSLIQPGVYHLAFEEGNFRLFVKKRKTLDKNGSRLPTEMKAAKFVNGDIHYLSTSTETIIIKNKKDLFEAIGENEQIKSFVKSERIRFRPNKVEFTDQIVNVLQYTLTLEK